ncbi:MAG: radical SAM/SPASM domain-containing protein [Patescibacteria group bacterium]|nr:radical SAM/SPASM domain-containing protein [Patescibacteria group bacterium]
MGNYLFTRSLVGAATNVAQTGWGQRLFRNSVTNRSFQAMFQKGLLHFLRGDDPARARMMADVACITSGLVTAVYSQNRPNSVKKAFALMIRSMATVSHRDRVRAECGAGPSFFVLNPTQQCNLSCYGCYDACRREGPSLSLDMMDYIVSEMKDFGIHFVVVSGGEPFMSEDFLKLAELHQDVVFMPYTNGTKIDGAVISELARLGNISPAISLEGTEAFTDGRRGKGHFQKMMEMIAALRKAGIVYGFSATCTRNNAKYLASKEFMEWCIAQGYLYGWLFQYIPIGRNPDIDLMATPEQRFVLGALVREIRAEHWPIFLADFWNDGQLVDGCIAAGRRYFHINAFGEIKPCVFAQVAIRDTVHLIKAGEGIHPSIAAAISKDPLMVAFRKNQEILRQEGHSVFRPCSVIDHPQLFRALCRSPHATPLTPDRCPPSMLEEDGEIARGLDAYAAAYAQLIDEKTDALSLMVAA